MLTLNSSGVNTIWFSHHNDSITVSQGCLGYKFAVRLSPSEDSLIFAEAIRYVRMDSAQFKEERRAFLESR